MRRILVGALVLVNACGFDTRGLRPRVGDSARDTIGEDLHPTAELAVDAPPGDAVADRASPDRPRDLPALDSPRPDLPRADHSKPDLAKPDLAKPDLAKPDLGKPELLIYGEGLAADWIDWSWSATVNLHASSPVKVGSQAATVVYQGWGGFSPRKGIALSTSGYSSLKLWVHGGTGSGKPLKIYTETSDSGGSSTPFTVTVAAGTWSEIIVPLTALGSPASIKRLNIQNNTPGGQPMVAFDEIRLAP